MKNCPNCNISWVGEKIPEDIAHHYADTHWNLCIEIDGGYMGIYDGTVAIKCHSCESIFPRNNSKWAMELFNKYLDYKKERYK